MSIVKGLLRLIARVVLLILFAYLASVAFTVLFVIVIGLFLLSLVGLP